VTQLKGFTVSDGYFLPLLVFAAQSSIRLYQRERPAGRKVEVNMPPGLDGDGGEESRLAASPFGSAAQAEKWW
jgi:hypothetical protein